MSRPVMMVLTLLALSTAFFSSWLGLWVIVELMLIMFLANTSTESEAKLKYFILQTISGLGWLLAVAAPMPLTPLFFMMLLLKLGLVPFFFWVPVVYSGMDMPSILMLSTVMKLPGIVLISHYFGLLFFSTMLISVVVGSLGGWGTTHLKKLLAWSSVTHTSWVCILMHSPVWAMLYFTIYALTLASFVAIPMTTYTTSSSQLMCSSPPLFMSYSCVWMSLAGLPPLMGFVLKWVSIEALTAVSGLLAACYIIIMAVSLYYYLQAVLMTATAITSPQRPQPALQMWLLLVVALNAMGLLLIAHVV